VKLLHLLEHIDIEEVSGDTSGDVDGIYYDSRKCKDGSLFVAVSGLKYDGHDFISEALKRGARYCVHEENVPPELKAQATFVRVGDSRRTLGKLGKAFYGNPSNRLYLIGVTGTNGKTTVTFFLESILRKAGFSVGVIGTVNYRYGGYVFPAPHTTPESFDLHKILREMADAGVTHVVMEVSSHAIDQGRIDECEFDMGIFTNLSQEHLDYHHSMEDYFLAKSRFFRNSLKEGTIIINGDDHWGIRLLKDIETTAVTFGMERPCDISVKHYELSIQGTEAKIEVPEEIIVLHSPIIGKFNLYNILAALSAALSLRISADCIRSGIEDVVKIPGRLEKVSSPDEPATFIDYAHTEDALRKVLENLSDFRKEKIITVFGCGGDRDRTKRPLMGKAATELSDFSIITSDNPRTEDPMKIIEDIVHGIEKEAVPGYSPEAIEKGVGQRGYAVVPDRLSAIELAVSMAGINDIVLIAGKGHEDYQILGDRRISFDDRIVASKALENWRVEEKH
jgi:UDP-N-acetylmuramoyl-L-alanyl-D-glutamate--2,6-diaminopimelate ligase